MPARKTPRLPCPTSRRTMISCGTLTASKSCRRFCNRFLATRLRAHWKCRKFSQFEISFTFGSSAVAIAEEHAESKQDCLIQFRGAKCAPRCRRRHRAMAVDLVVVSSSYIKDNLVLADGVFCYAQFFICRYCNPITGGLLFKAASDSWA
eukprot:IDg4241t1